MKEERNAYSFVFVLQKVYIVGVGPRSLCLLRPCHRHVGVGPRVCCGPATDMGTARSNSLSYIVSVFCEKSRLRLEMSR